MKDYSKIVKALRQCAENKCEGCAYAGIGACDEVIKEDAAAAIEDLQKDLTALQKCYEIADTKVDELLKQLPKRGEWVEDEETYAGQGLSNYKCSLCGKICGTWKRGLKADQLPSYCGNCGAKMDGKERGMSDLIDREAVREFIKSYRHSTDVAFHMEEHLDDIPAATRWVSVEDRLPPQTTKYLVMVGVNHICMGVYPEIMTALWHTIKKRFYVDYRNDMKTLVGDVTHWMPLPEPPKEEQDGK